MTKFVKEDRYIVLKKSNLVFLTESQRVVLDEICRTHANTRKGFGRPPLECVIVESDWPEYVQVWKSIEERS